MCVCSVPFTPAIFYPAAFKTHLFAFPCTMNVNTIRFVLLHTQCFICCSVKPGAGAQEGAPPVCDAFGAVFSKPLTWCLYRKLLCELCLFDAAPDKNLHSANVDIKIMNIYKNCSCLRICPVLQGH